MLYVGVQAVEMLKIQGRVQFCSATPCGVFVVQLVARCLDICRFASSTGKEYQQTICMPESVRTLSMCEETGVSSMFSVAFSAFSYSSCPSCYFPFCPFLPH